MLRETPTMCFIRPTIYAISQVLTAKWRTSFFFCFQVCGFLVYCYHLLLRKFPSMHPSVQTIHLDIWKGADGRDIHIPATPPAWSHASTCRDTYCVCTKSGGWMPGKVKFNLRIPELLGKITGQTFRPKILSRKLVNSRRGFSQRWTSLPRQNISSED